MEGRIAHNVAVSNMAPTSLTRLPWGGGSPPLESGGLVNALPIEYCRSDYMYYSQAGYQMAMQLPPLSRGTPLKIFIYLFIGCATQHMGSQFPDQGSHPCPCSGSTES